MKWFFTLLLATGLLGSMTGQANYNISGTLAGYDETEIYLGYYYADKQYLMDTSLVQDGQFRFEGKDTLKPGVYIVVMPPDNSYFQLMVNEVNSEFSFVADNTDLENSIQFENSPDNTLFYENLSFISAKRKEVEALRAEQDAAQGVDEKAELTTKLQVINDEVAAFQKGLVLKNPKGMTAALVRSGFNIVLPEFTGTDQEVQRSRYLYYKQHYFDHLDLSDDRMIRTPQHTFLDRINHYLEKLTPQHPDSIISSLDYLLSKLKPAKETYKYFLIEFLNEYAQSKIVGMDAVYVHLAENYYAKGEAPWVEESQLKKIIDNAASAKPTLIGQVAPNFVVQLQEGKNLSLAELKAQYIVLIFWAHDCGHCQESIPTLAEFQKEFHDEGIQVLSVCTKLNKDEPACWDFVVEKGLEEVPGWINTSDQLGGRSYMHSLYNIKKTPKLFVLDAEKKIISKDLSVEQLEEFFQQEIGTEVKGDQ